MTRSPRFPDSSGSSLPGSSLRRGFTLIELLVTLAILGIVLSSLYAVLTSTLKIRSRIEDREDAFVVGPAILDLIEDDIRGIYFTNIEGQAFFLGENQSVGGRDADRFDMVTTTDSRVLVGSDDSNRVRSDVTEVGYALRENREFDGYLELYRREDFFVDELPLEGGRYRRVYDRIRDFNVVYLAEGATGEDDPAAGQPPRGAEEGGPNPGTPGQGSSPDESRPSGTSKKAGKQYIENDDWDSRNEKILPAAMRIELTVGIEDPRTGEQTLYTFDRLISFPLDSNVDMSALPTLAEAGQEGMDAAAAGGEQGRPGGGGAIRGGGRGRAGGGRGGAGGIFEQGGRRGGGGGRPSGGSGGGSRPQSPF